MVERNSITDQIFTLSNVLSAAECHAQIEAAQMAGFDSQTYGARRPTDVRRRAVREDSALITLLWERIDHWLPPLESLYNTSLTPDPPVTVALSAYRQIGLNPRLRYYRYEPGESFPPHFDIAYEESPTVRSFLTVIVYLNDGYQGGETRFVDIIIHPRAGMALLFPHELRHEGAEISKGGSACCDRM